MNKFIIRTRRPFIFRVLSFAIFLCCASATSAKAQFNPLEIKRNKVSQTHLTFQTVRMPITDGKDIRFEHLLDTQGLSQTRADHILQDDQGFLWFATQSGLDRYDGYDFKVFTHDPAHPNSFSGGYINSLFKDRSGTIWVGTDQALDRFDRSTESFTHFHLDRQNPVVIHISQDSAGILWLATSSGLYRLNPANGSVDRFGHNPLDTSSLSVDSIVSTGEDRNGNFWVATKAGLDEFDRTTGKVVQHISLPESVSESTCAAGCRTFHEDRFGNFWIADNYLSILNRKTNLLTRYSFFERDGSPTSLTVVNSILEDHDGNMWFGTQIGLLKFDRANGKFIRYKRRPGDPGSLSENDVITLFEDREANIWVGLNAKIPDYFVKTQPAFESIRPGSSNFSGAGEDLVGAVYEDRRGTLWIGANGALNRLDRSDGQYIQHQARVMGREREVLTILEDRSDAMWVGTLGDGLLRFDRKTGQSRTYLHQAADPSSLSNNIVTRLFFDRSGTMWVNTWDGLNRFDPGTRRFTVYKRDVSQPEPYFSIVEDQNGFFWLGSQSGLLRFRPSSGQFTVFRHSPNDPTSLSNNAVDSIYQDHSGVLWLGTQDGLNRMDPKSQAFTTFYKKDGLPGNVVSCILSDDRDHLWMSTNNGLATFDPSTKVFQSYSVADGLPGNDLTGWDACFKSHTGEMFFGGFAGAVAFRPDKVLDRVYAASVVFTDFQLSRGPVEIGPGSPLKRSITYADDIKLPNKQDFFSLEFAALSFRSPSTIRASGNSSRMALIASTPFMSGICRSIKVTSGRCFRNWTMASRPVEASAINFMSD